MTENAVSPRMDYIGSGDTATYDFTFPVFSEDDLEVKIRDTDDVESSPTYSVTFNDNRTGSITLLAGDLTTDYKLMIRRAPASTQPTAFRNLREFYASRHEDALDRVIQVVQKVGDNVDHGLRFPITETTSIELPSITDRALKTLMFDAVGAPTAGADTTGLVSAAMNPVITAATLETARDEMGVVPNPVVADELDYTVDADADRGKVISIDATGGTRTVTLPSAAAAGNGWSVTIVKADKSENTVNISDSGDNKIGYDGPQFDVVDVSNNGSGNVRIELDNLTNGGENRIITDGDMVEIANVGGTTEANGVHSATRVAIGGNWGVDLTSVSFVNAYTSGGTVTLIRRTIKLFVQDSVVELVSDGQRWIIKSGSLDVTTWFRDVLFGHNVDYTGFDKYFNTQARTDFMWDACHKKLHTRSLVLNEIGDTPEIYFHRAATNGTYPDGSPEQIVATTNLGMIHWTGWCLEGSFQSRSAAIYCRAAEDITNSAAGGKLVFATTTDGTGAGTTDAVIIDSRQRVNIGTETNSSLLSVRNDTDEDKLKVTANSASFTKTIGYFVTGTNAGTGFNFIKCEANAGVVPFIVRGDGLITHRSTTLMATTVGLTNGASVQTGTLTNAPAAGNPTKWIPIDDNGTTRYIPAW
jgi:hypothetical protein